MFETKNLSEGQHDILTLLKRMQEIDSDRWKTLDAKLEGLIGVQAKVSKAQLEIATVVWNGQRKIGEIEFAYWTGTKELEQISNAGAFSLTIFLGLVALAVASDSEVGYLASIIPLAASFILMPLFWARSKRFEKHIEQLMTEATKDTQVR